MYKKTHQLNGIFNCINRNIVYPQLHFSRGLDTEMSVEITEINSDDDQKQNENGQIDNKRDEEIATNTQNINNEDYYSSLYDNIINYDAIRSIYNEFYNNDLNHNINCGNSYTYIDNSQVVDSSSEDDTYLDVRFNKSKESGWNKNRNPFMEDIIIQDYYDPSEDNMWFYSFKNTSYLSEINEILNDIDSIGSGSPEIDVQDGRSGQSDSSRRIPTPIPRYISKLNLSLQPTLSTVVEVTESKPSTSDKPNYADNKVVISKTTNGEVYEGEQNPLPKSQSGNDFTIALKDRKQLSSELEEISFQLKPNFVRNSWCSVIKPIPRDPEIIVSFKPQDNRQFITIEENDIPNNNPKNVWNTDMIDAEQTTFTSHSSATITDIKSDRKKITLVSQDIGNNELEINTEVCENNLSRQELDTLSDSNTTANDQPTHVDFFESTTEKNADTSSVDYKLSLNLTNSDAQTQNSWLQKILRCCVCCKLETG